MNPPKTLSNLIVNGSSSTLWFLELIKILKWDPSKRIWRQIDLFEGGDFLGKLGYVIGLSAKAK